MVELESSQVTKLHIRSASWNTRVNSLIIYFTTLNQCSRRIAPPLYKSFYLFLTQVYGRAQPESVLPFHAWPWKPDMDCSSQRTNPDQMGWISHREISPGWLGQCALQTTLPHATGDRLTISPQLLPFIFVPVYLFSWYQVQLTGSKTQLAKDLQRIITSCHKREGLDLHERDVLGQREKRPRWIQTVAISIQFCSFLFSGEPVSKDGHKDAGISSLRTGGRALLLR